MTYQILHNPRCSKSRQALQLITSAGIKFEIIDYLKDPISESELKEIVRKLGIKPYDLLRRNEAIFKEKFKGKELTDKQWIEAMVNYPKLIERPILITEDKAIVGRPPELVKELL